MCCFLRFSSPLGELFLASQGDALTNVWFSGQRHVPPPPPPGPCPGNLPVLGQARAWLEAYFQGRDPGPTPQLRPAGTSFQQSVWALLATIPYGRTISYRDLARQLALQQGRSAPSPRAVGGAVGRNPIVLFLPCHRVVGADGSLTGYVGGLERKRSLLALECGGQIPRTS